MTEQKLKCEYFEGSAKTGENINQALDAVATATFENWKKYNMTDEEQEQFLQKTINDIKDGKTVSWEDLKKEFEEDFGICLGTSK